MAILGLFTIDQTFCSWTPSSCKSANTFLLWWFVGSRRESVPAPCNTSSIAVKAVLVLVTLRTFRWASFPLRCSGLTCFSGSPETQQHSLRIHVCVIAFGFHSIVSALAAQAGSEVLTLIIVKGLSAIRLGLKPYKWLLWRPMSDDTESHYQLTMRIIVKDVIGWPWGCVCPLVLWVGIYAQLHEMHGFFQGSNVMMERWSK